MNNWIWFDLDGTVVNFYGVPGWLDYLDAYDPTPYQIASPLLRMNLLARYIHKAQAKGYKVGVISWLSKTSTPEFDRVVIGVKRNWLAQHLPSVKWDEIHIVPYGTPKHEVCANCPGRLFDDESRNRDNWTWDAFDETMIFEVIKGLI